MTKKKKYIPQRKYNPAQLAAMFRVVTEDLQRKTQVWEMEKAGIKNHFSRITNFTSHDVKNAIQNMDTIVSTLDIDNVTEEKIDTIKNCLTSMRMALDDFYRLSFEGRKIDFTLLELSNLVHKLNKASFSEHKIKFVSHVEDNITNIHQPFHNLLQVLNNLMINSVTAFNTENPEKQIVVRYSIEDKHVIIQVADNAMRINPEIAEQIFEIYFSTTGGSGIGLAHSTHIVENLGGTITLDTSGEEYCTKFEIKFPIQKND